ncbi:hypothetical protein JL2886_03230 [Phaeobacter gallaeciensis]|uniref:Uncharacterized protein n=1 Tax=Phaeobacter gallaeciensis TaxID=60890 RepID=A0A1B0ZVF5_9RHOB|nr:hypothetical protein JL2886_03230 [Phaeobacter gallaeciensis]
MIVFDRHYFGPLSVCPLRPSVISKTAISGRLSSAGHVCPAGFGERRLQQALAFRALQ